MPDPAPTETLVCIGGPADGRRITVRDGELWVVVPCTQPFPCMDWNPTAPPPISTVALSDAVYRRMAWRSEGQHIRHILVPDGQSPETTLNLLIDGYRHA